MLDGCIQWNPSKSVGFEAELRVPICSLLSHGKNPHGEHGEELSFGVLRAHSSVACLASCCFELRNRGRSRTLCCGLGRVRRNMRPIVLRCSSSRTSGFRYGVIRIPEPGVKPAFEKEAALISYPCGPMGNEDTTEAHAALWEVLRSYPDKQRQPDRKGAYSWLQLAPR